MSAKTLSAPSMFDTGGRPAHPLIEADGEGALPGVDGKLLACVYRVADGVAAIGRLEVTEEGRDLLVGALDFHLDRPV